MLIARGQKKQIESFQVNRQNLGSLKAIWTLMDGIDIINEYFSLICFTMLLHSLILVIGLAYMIIDEFMGIESNQINYPVIMMIFSLIFRNVFYLVVYNFESEDIKRTVKDLSKYVMKYKPMDVNMVFTDEQISDHLVKTIILKTIDDFEGFDGLGFFNLGKPLLTSIFANFVTYLIILMQFRLTES